MFRKDFRETDPNTMYTMAQQLLEKKLTQKAIEMLTMASDAKHQKSQLALAKIFEKDKKFEEAARLYFLADAKSELYHLYSNNVFVSTSEESLKITEEMVLSEKSLAITAYTTLLHKDDPSMKTNLTKLIEKFPRSFITLITEEKLGMQEYYTAQTKQLLTQDLQDRISVSVYVLSQPGLLPKVLVQIVAGYLNDSQELIVRNIKFATFESQGKNLQSTVDRQQKLKTFFNNIKNVFHDDKEIVKSQEKNTRLRK